MTSRLGGRCRDAHDATSQADWQGALAQVEAAFGGLNILVNNAGISSRSNIEQTELAEFHRVMTINVDSVYLGCQAALPVIDRSGDGAIVNLSSVSALLPRPHSIAYGTTKAAVAYMTKSVALYAVAQGYNVRCNSVHPAIARTPLIEQFYESMGGEDEALATFAADNPLGDILAPEDVAYGVLYLASDEARMVNGAELVIDGGMSVGR